VKFRKKPVVIEAVQYLPGKQQDFPEWWIRASAEGRMFMDGDRFVIKTIEGDMTANPGDWIIIGVENELYPCKNGIFVRTYECVETR